MKQLRTSCWLLFLCGLAGGVNAQTIIDVDVHSSLRRIPNLATGGTTTLDPDELIDVVILGDGYTAGEFGDFEADARDFYDEYFHPTTGMFPYTIFSEAFRVRAIFTPSNDRANDARDTYYRTDVTCSSADKCALTQCGNGVCWVTDPGADNDAFREAVFGAVDMLEPALNLARYPSDLSNAVSGGNIVVPMAGNYSNLYVGLIIRADETGPDANERPGGAFATTVVASLCDGGTNHGLTCTGNGQCPGGACRERRLRVALAQEMPHEFGHSFGYLIDEYICDDNRGLSAPALSEPDAQDRSVFLLSNLTYSDDRDRLPWRHLAPGSFYNPNPLSPVSNLYNGGCAELGVWHSDYKCLMNGQHHNYTCETSESFTCSGGTRRGETCSDDDDCPQGSCAGTPLRDRGSLCFWCQEILTVRILERTGQLACPGEENDINACGRMYWRHWADELRPRFASRFDLAGRISDRNACYGVAPCTNPSGCAHACSTRNLPDCLLHCDITGLVNAVYVDSANGTRTAVGTRVDPIDTLTGGISRALGDGRQLLAVNPGSYPGPRMLDDPVALIAGRCGSTELGGGP